MEERGNSHKDFKERLKATWIAIVDDQVDWAEILGGITKDEFGVPQEEDIPFHGFTSCESFIKRAGEYDVCVLDGDFGPRKMKGHDAVPAIRRENERIYIVGSSSEPLLNQEFERVGVDLVVRRDKLITEIPNILRRII